MGPLKRIFARKKAMCACRERLAIKRLTLPNKKKVNVCSECREEIEKLIARPIDHTKLDAILDRIYVDKTMIWKIPWNITPEELINNSPPEMAEQLKESKSPDIMSYFSIIEGVTVDISFHFEDKGLYDVMISPEGLLVDISRPLINRYGIPSDQWEMPGMFEESESEHITIWEKDGYEIRIDYTAYGFISISFTKRSI